MVRVAGGADVAFSVGDSVGTGVAVYVVVAVGSGVASVQTAKVTRVATMMSVAGMRAFSTWRFVHIPRGVHLPFYPSLITFLSARL